MVIMGSRSARAAFWSLAGFASALLPASARAQARFPIELRVEGHPAVLAEARSFFSRELRAIPDVAVVDSAGTLELLVLAGELRGGEGTIGIVVGATLLEIVDGSDLGAVESSMDPELLDYLRASPLRIYKNMWIFHGGPGDMDALARQIVAEIDVSVLEEHR